MINAAWMKSISAAIALALLAIFECNSVVSQEVDMRPHWNDQIALANPHKGGYHHYPDNHINKYVIREDAHLLDFPGMDHLYIRLSWAYLEPEEGKFNWTIVDDLVNKWTDKGLKVAFRISCKETNGYDRIEQQFATPKWVMEAGAKGEHYIQGEKVGPEGPWEPVFDDPIFLQKLEAFLRVFAARYDGKPWLRYVDIGSIGDWGEGHTWAGSRIEYTIDQKKTHIDLYCRCFQSTQLIISDDFVYNIKNPENRAALHQYLMQHGISYRDDSILVDGYLRNGYSQTYSVRSPEFYEDTYRKGPTVLELQHYYKVKSDGNWLPKEGSALARFAPGQTGPDFFRGAMGLIHPTYIGYHGDAHEWLTENPELTVELLNRCGYWFFLHQVNIPTPLRVGKNSLQMIWENRGVAPAYRPYVMKLRLAGPRPVDIEIDSGNRDWMPASTDGVHREEYTLTIPERTPPGQYELKIKLYSHDENEDVLLALNPGLMDMDYYDHITTVEITDKITQ